MCPAPHDAPRWLGPSRPEAARQGQEAVAIAKAGGYTAPSGRRVEIGDAVARAVQGTVDYPPGAPLPPPPAPALRTTQATRIRVTNRTSLASAREIVADGPAPLVLNFASAKHPGGGFLGGARAQEESLARSSALYPCLLRSRMYAHHEAHRDPVYTSWMIYSPDVPVFRDDESGALLEESYACAFVTAPAPNAKVVLERAPHRTGEVRAAMEERIDRFVALAIAHGHRRLVLGAWGCGVFGNDPAHVAGAFSRALEQVPDAFDEIDFAVLDGTAERRFFGPFARVFGGPPG